MKKLLLSTLALVATMFAANAAESTFDWGAQGLTNAEVINGREFKTPEGITIKIDKATSSSDPAFYTAAPACARMYAGNTVTFTAPAGGTLTNIEFGLSTYTKYNMPDGDDAFVASSGTFTSDPTTTFKATWTGSAETVTIELKNQKNAAGKNPQFRACTYTFTYTAGVETVCATPKFSIEDGKYYTTQSVEITSNTDGAKIMYTLDGGAETEYTAPVEVAGTGKHVITAKAVKAGLEDSQIATANIEIAEPIKVPSIDDFKMNGEAEAAGTYFEWTFPVTVVRQVNVAPTTPDGDKRNNIFVKDANGDYMLVFGYGLREYANGDVIPAGVVGEYTVFNGLPEMKNPVPASLAAADTEKGDCTPIVMSTTQVSAADLNKIIYLDNVTYNEVTDATTGKVKSKVFTDGTTDLNVYWQKGWLETSPETGTVLDCIAAVATFNGNLQVNPIEILDASAEPGQGSVESVDAENTVIVANANGIVVTVANAETATIFNAAGQVVKAANVAAGETTINVPAGFYVAKVGNKVAKVVVR